MTYKVKTKANNNPPMMEIPIGIRLVEAPPKASAMGKAPKTVAKDVIKIGLNLCDAA